MEIYTDNSLQQKIHKNKFEFLLDIFFWLFVLIIIHFRYQVYQKFNLVYIDSDQPHMWLGASDYAKGLFHEPRYYGQAYNTFMEALFAVPFLWLGLEVYAAVPLATHIIFLFPILFTAFYLYFNSRKWNGVFVLLIIICLPNSYDFLTSLPRGFVTGLFFTSFYVLSIIHPTNLRFVFINTALSVLAFFVNPNSVIVSAPFLFYLFLINYKTKSYYWVTGLGLIISVPLYFLFDWFYVLHPDYITLKLSYNMSSDYFKNSFLDLDRRFAQVSFFIENNCVFLLLSIIVFGFLFFKRDKKVFFAYLLFLLVILTSFFSGKTREGSTWIYYTYSRMYLGIPVLLYLFLSTKQFRIKEVYALIFLLPLFFANWKYNNFNQSLAQNVKLNLWIGVNAMKLSQAIDNIFFYNKHCKEQRVTYLAISGECWQSSILAYGGPAILSDFPVTENLKQDRRYWVREGNKNKVFTKFILLARKNDLEKQISKNDGFELQNIDGWGMYLVSNNHLSNEAFKKMINQYEFEN